MKIVSLLIKPVSGACNLRCKYCFYHELETRGGVPGGRMAESTLENLVRGAFEAAESAVCFAFQGGEPMLAGLEFFEKFAELEEKYRRPEIFAQRTIQTNGTLITPEWAAFFKKHGFVWQQYIPCLSPLGNSGGNSDVNPDGSAPEYDDNNTSEFLSAEEYGSFLCRIFDLWYSDMISGRYIYNRTFENYVGILMGRHPEECGMCGFCTVQYVLEADGGVYPCDFYVLDAYRLGNFVTDPLEDINRRADELGFVAESRQINEKCRTCRYVALCRGGCRRNREPFIVAEDGSKVPSLNRFCRSYEMFFEHSADRLMTLARLAMRRG